MECHKCAHALDIEAGKCGKVAFEDTPCAVCKLKEHSGRTIEFDPDREKRPEGVKPKEYLDLSLDAGGRPDSAQGDGGEPGEARLPISVMREAVATLLSLPPEVRDVVCWRYAGMKYPDIALTQDVTTAAVEVRHKRAMRRHPVLRALFPEKAAKQLRRKPHARRAAA